MVISTINTTALRRQDVQDRIRAVNRQLQEDFRRYWHQDVQLRLEGWTGETLDPNRPLNMRGDAVIYLWDGTSTANALGYHDLNYRGVPFGFVFPRLSERLGEDWSVTLSHEALELAGDPETNRLVQGPHPDPDEGGRLVFHWYELCDAVQADTYLIDGVAVSNFVLPLYFTESEEHLNHNDFLGRGVPSFGVRAGGYVGFFDPEKGRHVTYHLPEDETSAHRLKAKGEFANAKRTDRRGADGDVLDDPRRVSCDAISFELLGAASSDGTPPLESARSLVATHLGDSWKVRACPGDGSEFDAIHTGPLAVTFAAAWEAVHLLEQQSMVRYAEPSFVFPIPGESDAPDDDTRRRAIIARGRHKPGTECNYVWALEQCNVPAAWDLIKDSPMNPGEGILIGHPDSGFIKHDEMDLARVRDDIDWDFVQHDFETRAETGRHGLATASVIMSGRGGKIQGPACYAEILPLRVTKPRPVPAPVLVFGGMRRLRDAVDYAVKHGAGVISMSLGGLPYRGLRKAIRRANEAGVIVCAAAGNEVGFVVWPACYEETIAVAGCNVDRRAWPGSSRGAAVDVTAPAESVWHAAVDKRCKRVVSRGSGTSYAVGLTAAVAAMWLSYRRSELQALPPAEIPELFRQLLKATASTDHELDARFGAGIVDAAALLSEPIPQSRPVRARSSHAEPGVHDIPDEEYLDLKDLNDLPEAYGRELLCAHCLTAMTDASEPQTLRRGRASMATNTSGGARRLSPQLTQWLAENHPERTRAEA